MSGVAQSPLGAVFALAVIMGLGMAAKPVKY